MGTVIRRLENNLATLGGGIIAFGFWAFVKFALSFMPGTSAWDYVEEALRTAVTIITWMIAALIALIYLWVGLSARAEAAGKRKSVLYLIAIGFIIIFSTAILVLEVSSVFTEFEHLFRLIIALIIDVTRLVFLVELLASSIKLRVLRKQLSRSEGGTA